MSISDIGAVAPELILAIYAMAMLLIGAFGGGDRQASRILRATVVLLVLLGLYVGYSQGQAPQSAFSGSFMNDNFARFAKVVILIGAGIMLLLSEAYLTRERILKFEYPILIALAVLGMMLMVSAGDLMALYLGLELQSLSLYVVAAFRRDSERSTEAGLKYFVLGALSSGMLLYGASFVYGYAGSTQFSSIFEVVSNEGLSMGLLFGIVFMCVGLAFKVSAAPFHMWTPDVYEGSPTPVTGFFATAPKVAAAALFARLLIDAFEPASVQWAQILAFLSVASIFVGAIAAIGQRDIKRMMAYSSIGHMGFALMGLAAGGEIGVQSLLVYVTIYLAMNIGVFAFILNMEQDGRPVTDIYALGRYAEREPLRAICLALLMFSLAGVPPLVGFFGKFFVISAAVSAGLTWLAVAGVVGSVISAFYYLRIIYIMYFGDRRDVLNGRIPVAHLATLVASALIMVAGIINLFGVDQLAQDAAASLFL